MHRAKSKTQSSPIFKEQGKNVIGFLERQVGKISNRKERLVNKVRILVKMLVQKSAGVGEPR